ncbi:MAG: HlyC/CorC family transporter [Flavobacteriaceae bacterium]|jgi:CBS domain containing-hemolysin-like protein|nr:HlyC/CorC family transporter [Flavobacteriaceae bacterium]
MEIAYISANKIHLELEKKQEGVFAAVLRRLTAKPSKFITTMLIGNNIALVIYGLFMGDILMNWFEGLALNSPSDFVVSLLTDFSLLSQTVLSTLVILITAEFLPKVFFQIYANSLIKIFAIPAYLFYWVFSIVSNFIIFISDMILKLFFNTEGDEVQSAFSKTELGNYINEQMESVEEEDEVDSEIQIFKNALEFTNVKAREIMVPRTDLVAVDLSVEPKKLIELFSQTGFSKLLVFEGDLDNIIGYIHSYALFKKPSHIKKILMPIEYVPETMLISDILDVLTKKRKSVAIVLDEYGGTSGMMTVEDIIEELFGEIEDEHDSTDLIEEEKEDGSFVFSARLEVDYLNETYGLDLAESDQYNSLGGLIVNNTEEIPELNESIDIENCRFTILEVSGNKIDLVRLQVLEES